MRESASGCVGSITIYNETRQKFVATQARTAESHFSRLIGLLGTTRSWVRPGNGLWIVPSHGVHTFGMAYALDLVFLDRACRVVAVQEYLRPFRISKISLKAHSVLELPTQSIFTSETQVGDHLVISPMP